ncbi:MAG TPA: DUF3300 domain-containing protein [Bryobacteraceae bacterium]|nr:DUF3300 domain-containing protein [Bryobacteraceae bacterium]
MKRTRKISGYQIGRQSLALALSILLVPFASGDLNAQGVYTPLDAPGLDQLVAPIALYPDSLVAQILTASTYPQQVSDADNWSRQNASLPPQERANIANGMPWDPSVKALTAFPGVLDNLARNYNWMAQLGNAYYNQPGDVMNAVQAARVQAQQAGYLRSTPQQRVYYSGGQIVIDPVNPNLVYVPYYNPWRIYGGWVSPYAGYYVPPPPPGFAVGLGIGFFAGISIGLFAGFGWGWHHWAPSWRGGYVAFNHAAYISRSPTVFNHGHFGEYNRGVFEHAGRGVPAGFHPAATRATASFGRPGVGARPGAVRPETVRPQVQRGQVERGQVERGQVERSQAARGPAGRAPAARAQNFERPAARAQGARPQARGGEGRPAGHAAPAHAAPHAAPRGGGHGGEHEHK